MVYKAKIELLDEIESEDTDTNTVASSTLAVMNGAPTDVVESTQQLPGYLSRLGTLNPDVLYIIERDPVVTAHFARAIVALDPLRFFSKPAPLVFGIESIRGSRGIAPSNSMSSHGAATQLVCVESDANLSTITFAFALVPEPSKEHVTWFMGKLIDCGYPLQNANAVFTDGRWQVVAACARVGVQRMMHDTSSLIADLTRSLNQPGYIQANGMPLPISAPLLLTANQATMI